jgi:toxin-antitoxin system PIN domain toxin
MTLADVDVLIHAFRSDSSDHLRCRRWLQKCVDGDSSFGVSPQVLSGVIRITTHPRVFVQPSSTEEVLTFCNTLMAMPHVVHITPAERHWGVFVELCRKTDIRGRLVPDAWYAALAIESGCEWVTLDRDYARFPGLKWSLPE